MTSLTDQEKEIIKKWPIGHLLDFVHEEFRNFTIKRSQTSSLVEDIEDFISSVDRDNGTSLST